MKVCEAGQTLAYRCVVVCDVHASGALTMNADSHFCCILFSYTSHVLFLGVKFAKMITLDHFLKPCMTTSTTSYRVLE